MMCCMTSINFTESKLVSKAHLKTSLANQRDVAKYKNEKFEIRKSTVNRNYNTERTK